jgi:glycosyltransferase involved in cell wall biosynthesis
VSAGADVTRCRVVPPFHHCDRLRAVDGDPALIEQYSDGAVNILTVGRLAPNKNHRALIEAFSLYTRHYNARSRLFVVGGGDPNLAAYVNAVKTMAKTAGLERNILFTGKVSDAALKSYYLLSDLFMTTSLHEGFCVPLIEAMSLHVPVVAYGSAAVPETAGNACVVWPECDPALMAASADRIVRDESLRIALAERGWKRYWDCFRTASIERTFLEAMKGLW